MRDHALDVRRGAAADDRRRDRAHSPMDRARRSRASTRACAGAQTGRSSASRSIRSRATGRRTRTKASEPHRSDGIAAPVDRPERPGPQERAAAPARRRTSSRRRTLATVQHALLRGIEAVFQLEEGEILAEPMPTRDERNGLPALRGDRGRRGRAHAARCASPSGSPRSRARRSRIMHFDVGDRAALPDVGRAACRRRRHRVRRSLLPLPDVVLQPARSRAASTAATSEARATAAAARRERR